MTRRLFDEDSYTALFYATVLKCEKCENGYCITLDKTAFFPTGGGQSCDTGKIGDAEIRDVFEKDGEIFHIADRELIVGKEYDCGIDWDKRFSKMQNHTGEHILSGLAHTHFGCTNVGFHLGNDEITIDFDKKLSDIDIAFLEMRANKAVFNNLAVKAYYPEPSELEKMNYRSKLDLKENVRIVDIFGVDLCACCAPHVKSTGAVGLIKIVDFQSYKGGTRLYILCGKDAYEDYVQKSQTVREISVLLSAKQSDIDLAVKRIFEENAALKAQISEAKRKALNSAISKLETGERNLCIFADDFDANQMRQLANKAAEMCEGICGIFSQKQNSFSYVITSRNIDLKTNSQKINAAISGKGGGQSTMICGSAFADKEAIISFIENFEV